MARNHGAVGNADLIARIHNSRCRVVMHITGGGMVAIPDLLTVPGASRTILDVTVPYSPAALAQIIASADVGAVSEPAAIKLADAAFLRAQDLAGMGSEVAGIGCTAALSTDRVRKGPDRAYVAVRMDSPAAGDRSRTWFIDLSDDDGASRVTQDRRVGDAVLHAVAIACGVTDG